ncbi:EAL domain-containing protein [Bradyrhizobium sp. LjRoot220]|uniref:EAL domain-containing protein n=1 Tax=Bradyrhizobium sp. LjRoot220 TaxID=3342284 RepID=UPI003ECCCAA7
MSRLLQWWQSSLGARLYSFAFLTVFAVGALATASIHFSRSTEQAAHQLYDGGLVRVLNSSRLELLLEQHRRIVESMPAEVDRATLKQAGADLAEIQKKLFDLSGELLSEKAGNLERSIVANLPRVFELGDRVAFFATNFAQDKAIEAAGEYSDDASATQSLIRSYREDRVREANAEVSRLVVAANSFKAWVVVFALLALVLVGPLGLTTVQRVISRLRKITEAMIQLAMNDTSVVVPSHQDADEVGKMARAVEVFKENAIQLITRETELAATNNRFDAALNNMVHGLCMYDADALLIVCNQSYQDMYQLPPELCRPGTPLHRIEQHRMSVGNAAMDNPDRLLGEVTVKPGEASVFFHELKDGRIIGVSQKPMPGAGWVAVHEDVTQRRQSESRIAHLARHDMLTGLPSRLLLREHLERAVGKLKTRSGFVVFCLDLDQFKQVNDTLGHAVGDELLKLVAMRLRDCIGDQDLVARLGGDEFAIVYDGVQLPERRGELAASIIRMVSEPYEIEGRHIVIGASIGVASAPGDGSDPDQLLKNADMALYLAKGGGRGTYRFFEPEMDRRLQARLTLQTDLRLAIVNGELELYYQPLVGTDTRQIIGFEALVRWNHPQRGLVLPNEFISLAEETGLILPLGEWVLRNACSQAAGWPRHVSVAVNLSPVQFKSGNIVQMVVSALAASGLPPARLELEITEAVLMQDTSDCLATLNQLRALGIRISMDDFGTGYSSLSYLQRFPFDKIKIDRSFIRDLALRDDCKAIVRAITSMARSLKMKTVAEGVETVEQFNLVAVEGCDQCQGYYFGRPMKIEKVMEALQKDSVAFQAA